MTKEEIKQKTSLCFLLNQNVPEEEKNYVIERVMATKATIVSKAALCNIITYILKQNAELKEKNQQLTKVKELIKEMLSILPKENIEGVYEITEEAEQFLREIER